MAEEGSPPLRVVHITSVHTPFDTRIFHRQCRTLSDHGYAVTLLAAHDRDEIVAGVTVKALHIPRGKLARRTIALWSIYRRARAENAVLYHFHDPELIPVGLALRFLARRRVLYDLHEYYSEVVPARNGYRLTAAVVRTVLSRLVERWPVRWFDTVVYPTHALAEAVDPSGRGLVLLNFPSAVHGEAERSAMPWSARPYDVICVGTISPPRLRFMTQIIEQLAGSQPGLRWLFVGLSAEAERWMRANCPGAILEKHVGLLQRVPHERVLELMRTSRVGFNYHPDEPRFRVAIPMKVFEYMRQGLPVVTSAMPELERFLERDAHAILVRETAPAAYAEAIRRLLVDETAALELGRRGLARVTDSLTWEASEAPKLLRHYGDLLEGVGAVS